MQCSAKGYTEPLEVVVDGGLLLPHVVFDEPLVAPLEEVPFPRGTRVRNHRIAGDLAVVNCTTRFTVYLYSYNIWNGVVLCHFLFQFRICAAILFTSFSKRISERILKIIS